MTRKTTAYARRRAQGTTRPLSDGITMTRMHNTRLNQREYNRIMEPCRSALAAFRSARATCQQWRVLCTAVHVARAIEDGGVYRGQIEIIEDARTALESISKRMGDSPDTWRPSACYAPEITALADLVAAHARQLAELTYGEYTAAADKAVARVASVRGQVIDFEMSTT